MRPLILHVRTPFVVQQQQIKQQSETHSKKKTKTRERNQSHLSLSLSFSFSFSSSSSFISLAQISPAKDTHPLIFDINRSMRIRKRSGPLGLPSISTTILSHSDPPLSTRKHEEEEEEDNTKRLHPSFGDQHQPSDQVHQTSRTSSDLELTFIRGNNGWVCCGDGDREKKKKKDEYLCMMNTNPTQKMEEKEEKKELERLKEEEEEKMIRQGGFGIRSTTKNRKSNSLGGEEEVMTNFGSGVPPFSSNNISSHDHHQVLLHERWCEGVKGFPLKKRRGSNCERKVVLGEEETRTTMEIKQKKIMKTTYSNRKWVLHEKDSQEIIEEEDHVLLESSTSSVKKNEGSRCSRINGRGWRCCQQTLVGYSLCEHHSGKGRLRNMSSVRNRSTATVTKPIKNVETRRVSLEKCEDEEEDDDDDEEKTSTMRIENKKRKKMGMVKARSISSLLGQTQVHDDYVKV